jgi:hypothetical protein
LESTSILAITLLLALTKYDGFTSFSTQKKSADALVPLASRMAQDLAPFLLVTSEDTLALVADSLLAVIEVNKSQWLTQELAAPMINALMQVWVKNVRGN